MEAFDDTDEQQLYEHHRFSVDRGQEAMRLDRYLQMRIEGISRSKVQAAVKAGCVKVNGVEAKSNYKVKPLDDIAVLLPEPPHTFELLPEEMPLNIVYEDAQVLVVDKPAGLVVHPGVGNWTGTLVNGLLHYLGSSATPYLVHRIDKDTSGLLLVAKTEEAQAALARQFFEHSIERKYNALVWGDFNEDNGTIVGNLGRDPRDRRRMAVYPHEEGLPDEQQRGKHAVTHWHVLERFGYVTLIECVLETGRTHQIRAHMRHIGHPLFSDATYGGDAILKGTTFTHYRQFVENCFALCPRQALHARVLGFVHPTTGETMHFESPWPPDMTLLVERWRNYATHAADR
ncbi:MAG: RluA family pseudouridine synthase [Bacteroidales bacterium]|nr:RluA family pseudouridine synthase [Bacteroidales bacterium]